MVKSSGYLWRLGVGRYAAGDLVFLNASVFNEKTGCRYSVHDPISSEARYSANVSPSHTYSICATKTISSRLFCTGVRQSNPILPDLLN